MATPQKIEKLKKQGRVLWPKYDPDLDTQVNGRPRIHDYVNHIFTSSDLQGDLALLRKQRNLDDLIDREVQKKVNNDLSPSKPGDPSVSLNQAQVFNVIGELYGIDTTIPSRVGKQVEGSRLG